MTLFEVGPVVVAGGSTGVPVEAGTAAALGGRLATAVGLSGRVGAAVGVAVAEADGWVDAPWHAARSNKTPVTISPKANLRNFID